MAHPPSQQSQDGPSAQAPGRSVGRVAKICVLWVHGESFSKQHVIFNASILPTGSYHDGSLYSISNLDQTRSTSEIQDMEPSQRHRREKMESHEHIASSAAVDKNVHVQRKIGLERKFLFVSHDMDLDQKNKYPQLQISVSEDIARTFGFENRSNVLIVEEDPNESYASHIEISFRDVYLARGDMWRMASSELNDTAVFEGQKLLFLGTIKAMVKKIYAMGRRVRSAKFSAATRLIFRSDAARFVIYIQLSREMWEFDDASGDIMFNKVVYGFLPELFRRWYELKVRHLVTIVLFTRVGNVSSLDSDSSKLGENRSSWTACRDFYRVVTSDMSSGDWAAILTKLKQDFKIFLRDVSLHPAAAGLSPAEQSSYQRQARTLNDATNGNILEAINLASAHFERDYVDRDLARTGLSIIVITPGTGVFRVDESLLQLTTERLINSGIGIDLVCLSRRPLHSVPLFRYTQRNISQLASMNGGVNETIDGSSRQNHWNNAPFSRPWSVLGESRNLQNTNYGAVSGTPNAVFAMPHWVNVSFWAAAPLLHLQHANGNFQGQDHSLNFQARCRMYELQMMGFMENEASNISIPYLYQHMRRIEAQKYQDFTSQQQHEARNSFQDKPGTLSSPWQSGKLDAAAKLEANKSNQPSYLQADGELIVQMEMYDNDVFTPTAPEHLDNDEESIVGEDVVNDGREDLEPIQDFSGYGVLRGKSSAASINASAFRSGNANPTLSTATSDKRHSAKAKEQTRKGLLSLSLAYQKKASPVTGSSVADPKISSFTYKPTEPISTALDTSDDTVSRRIRQSLSRTTTSISAVSAEAYKPITKQDHDSSVILSGPVEATKADHETSVAQGPAKANVAAVLNKASAPRKAPPRDTFSKSPDSQFRDNTPQANSSPWLTLLNPSNPQPESRQRASDYNRWQHVFPYESRESPMKWESLCSPASLPLTNGYFPTSDQLKNTYTESPYKIAVNEGEDDPKVTSNRQRVVRELIDFRLSRGFQIVTSSETDPAPLATSSTTENNIYATKFMADVGDIVHLSKGNTIHQIICGDASEIQITLYKKSSNRDSSIQRLSSQLYEPMVRALTADNYTGRALCFSLPEDDYNWNYVDNFLAGYHQGDMERLRSWRSRFVLLPMELNTFSRRGLSTLPEDSEEETRIEGLRKLTQMWQRFRHIPIEERRHHTSLNLKKDPNPLKLEFQTRDPSLVVALGFDNTFLNEGDTSAGAGHLFAPESDLYRTTSFDLNKLAGDIQGDKGIRIQNRRWHWKVHLASFVGADMTTWLLANFADIESREEAVDLGNVLMEKGLFQHVSKKHKFRDGHFFYTFSEDYLAIRPESRMSWFGSTKRADRSIPGLATPDITKEMSSPDPRRRQEVSEDLSTPTMSKKPFVSLSSKIAYDVDHRKRSDRPEVIDLHYDRLHNPGNAFHLQVVWSRATGGLIEESVANWSMLAEKHGLRLVQVPIFEASSLSHVHPFREPHPIQLALLPPGFNASESAQITSPRLGLSDDRYMYHKEILKKLNYVLDVEAATNFPSDIEVTFSWGKPDYKASQYIHKSGLLLMQISADGRFLLVANRLCNNRILARDSAKFEKGDVSERRGPQSREGARHSPFASPAVKAVQDGSPVAPLFAGNEVLQISAAQLKDEFEAFCFSKEKLQAFYEETSKSEESALSTPLILPSEASIPKFGLPPPLELREYPAIAASRQPSTAKALTNLAILKSPGRAEQGSSPQPSSNHP